MAKGKYKGSINSSKAISLLGEGRTGVATSLWGIFSEFNIQSGDPDALHTKEQLNISSLHSSFVPIFTNISKKDGLTRMKGLSKFKERLYELHENSDPDVEWEPVLSNFTYIYIRVGVYDSDIKIRRLSNECLSLLHKIVGGKMLEKFCKLFFPALWLSCNDPKPEVSKSALDCLEGLVGKNKQEKIVKLIKFCSSSMFDLYGRLLSCNLKSIKGELNANVSSQSEEEELFDRIISISIASVRKVMQTLQNDSSCLTSFHIASHIIFTSLPLKVSQIIQKSEEILSWNTLQTGTMWKFISNNYSSIIRADAIQLLTCSMSIILNELKIHYSDDLDNLSSHVPSISKQFVDSLKCLNETSNSNVQAVSPKLISTFLKLFPEIWHQGPNKLFGSPIKYFTKALLKSLSNPNQISCKSLFSELPYIIANIPFQILLDEFSNLNNEIHLINEIINKPDFYFKTFNELMILIYESIQENSLPLLCVIPLGIILHLVKFSSESEDDSTRISLATPNNTLLNCSFESYYTILLHFLHKKFITVDETQLREFLINYFSKIIWSPIIFILTINKTATSSSNSARHSKAQFKINEQFSNMMMNSVQYHNWSVEQCRERNLQPCISNLNDFLTGYWTRYYINKSNKNQTPTSMTLFNQNSYKIIIFLELCSTLNKYDSEFIDNVLLWLEETSHETFLLINLLECNNADNHEFEIMTLRSKLINKAITEVIIKPIDGKDSGKTQQVVGLFFNTFTDFIRILSEKPIETNIRRIHAIYQVLESIFTPFILAISQKELNSQHILDKIVVIITSNTSTLTSITIESFLYNQLINLKTSLSQFFLDAVCKELPQVNIDMLDDISKIFTSSLKYEIQQNSISNKNKANNLTDSNSESLNFKECYMNFFVELSKISATNLSKSFSEFLMSLIILQLKSAFRSKTISRSNLKDTLQVGALLTNFFDGIKINSEEFITELLTLLIYSDNDFWFENTKSRKVLIPIIDSIFSKSNEIINSRYRNEMSRLEKILLSQVFNIGDEIGANKAISIYKPVLLVDRNSNRTFKLNQNSYSKWSYENETLFNRLVRIISCLNNSVTNKSVQSQKDLFETGFRIRRFLRVFMEVVDISSQELNSNKLCDDKNSKISYWLIIYIVKHLFISEESIKIFSSSRELSLDKEFVLDLFNFIEFTNEDNELSSMALQFSQYLISEHIENIPDLQQISCSAQFILEEYNIPESRFVMTLASDFFLHLFELMNECPSMRDRYLSIMIDYLDSNILEGNSISLFLFLIKMNKRGGKLPESYYKLSRRILDEFETELKRFSDLKEKDYMKIYGLIHCIKEIIIEEGVKSEEIELDIVAIMSLLNNLTEEICNLDICNIPNTCDLLRLCNLTAALIELLQEYLTIYIQGRYIQDNIEIEFQYGKLEISKLIIKLSSSIHYLIGKAFEMFTSEIINDQTIVKKLDEYSMSINYLVLSSIKFSGNIYQKIKLHSEDQVLLDELRFTNITIQLETNILSTFDKFLGLISTLLISKRNYAKEIGLRIFVEQMLVLKNSENVARMWILAVLESKLGNIRENSMEISKLLTTKSLKLHSFVLLILKDHNWYSVQYEYSDLNNAIASIEKLDKCIREHLISKNKDDEFDEIEGYEQNQDQEDELDLLQEGANSGINVSEGYSKLVSKTSTLDFDSENFEKGIEVIASHWRRLIGPSLAQQLLETYFSSINISYFEEFEDESSTDNSGHSISLNSIYMDVSQRLGCWNFILPRLISEDFVICTDKENQNIKTIEKNLTPCIESLLELNPIVIGEALREKQVDLRSQTINDFLPSHLEDEDTSVCQALQYFVKRRKTPNLTLDEIVLKNTTFSCLMDILDAPKIQKITQKAIKLSLIHVLVELAFQTLVILEDHIKFDEINNPIDACSEKVVNSQTNWLALFKHSSNAERRKLLTANLEEILQIDPNSSSETMVWDSSNLYFTWLLATRIILSLTTYFPRILREIWLCNSNKKTQIILQKLVNNYFSPIIIPIELSHIPLIIEKMSNPDRKITFDHIISSRTIKIGYSERGFTATLSFTFSQHHPLVIPKVNIPSVTGVSKKQNSNWLISVIKAVRYRNVTHAILTWINNLSLYLNGVEDCLICYSIVHPQYRSLPRKRCNTCNNVFHSECIYKWFRTSNKTTCPLCISIMH